MARAAITASALVMLAAGLGCQSKAPAASAETAAETTSTAAAEPAPTLTVAPGAYAQAFEAAKRALRDVGFLLERVDAQAGVITTQPNESIGVFAPWDPVQSGVDQELDDAMHRQNRVVRVEFAPADAGAEPAAIDTNTDLRQSSESLAMRVQASVNRIYYPGRRINTGHILYSTRTYDPALGARNMASYSVAIEQDSRLAQRIVDRVRAALDAPAPPAAQAPAAQ